MRSFPSVYQLLPIYPVLDVDGTLRRVAELPVDVQLEFDRGLAADALAFHREIESAVDQHLTEDAYRRGFVTVPFVGTHQPTRQSAAYHNGTVSLANDLPPGIDPLLADGDGTVPRLSAIPIEMSNEYRDTFVSERHSSLQNHRGVLTDLRARLQQMQVRGLGAIRGGPKPAPRAERRAAIALDVDDLYRADEAVELGISVTGDRTKAGSVVVTITPVGSPERGHSLLVSPAEGGSVVRADVPARGLYRVAVEPELAGPESPTPVHDVFAVMQLDLPPAPIGLEGSP